MNEIKSNHRIIQIVSTPDGGGAEYIARELCINLRKKNIDCQIIYFSNPKNIKLEAWEICLGDYKAWDVRNYFLLSKKIISLRIDSKLILHSHLTWPFLYTSLLLKKKNMLKVYTEHNTYNRRRKYSFLRNIERLLYQRYDFIFCISEATRKSLESWLKYKFKKRCKVIYNGSRKITPRNCIIHENKKLDIISIGSLTNQKGFDISIKAISYCRDIVNSYNILGEGKERSNLQRTILELKLSNKIFLKGYKNDIKKFLYKANLAIISSRWEGFGLVATEFLSAGIPIVYFNVPGLNEVLSGCEAAIAVNDVDAKELSNAITLAKQNLVANAYIYDKAIEHSNNFTNEKMVDNYLTSYLNIKS
tara:strand:- start:8208 stop:9293 length:1086 start_codon:yes stop_codon:yes gene_type:complete